MGRGWGGGGAGPNLCVGVTALVVPLEFQFVALNFAPGATLRTAGDCFIAKIMCLKTFSLRRSGVEPSQKQMGTKKNNAKCPSNSGRGAGGGEHTRPSVEVYRGKIGVKMPFLPQKCAGFAQKSRWRARGDLGGKFEVCHRVRAHCRNKCRTLVWPHPPAPPPARS